MIALYKGQTSSPNDPALTFIAQVEGILVPALSLSFQIFEVATDPHRADPLQVFPTSGGAHTVDLVNDLISTGYYVARWTVPADAAIGKYEIRWTFALSNPWGNVPPAGTTTKTFEVLTKPALSRALPQYALVSDIRDEGLCTVNAESDARIQKLIQLASSMIERITGRYFFARYGMLDMVANPNATNRTVTLAQPVVGIDGISLDSDPTVRADLALGLDLLRVYNRHLNGMVAPDDRENPRVEFVYYYDAYGGSRLLPFHNAWVRSYVHVRGFFGYTEPDGSPWGETPLLIQHACKLIVARELPKLSQKDDREDALWRWRVTSETARDQSITMAAPRKFGEWFGDPEIDMLLVPFVRPPEFGSA